MTNIQTCIKNWDAAFARYKRLQMIDMGMIVPEDGEITNMPRQMAEARFAWAKADVFYQREIHAMGDDALTIGATNG